MKRFILIAALICIMLPIIPVNAQADTGIPVMTIAEEGDTNSPRADILQWRYKIVDGKIYKRLYNASTGHWVGDWILCT